MTQAAIVVIEDDPKVSALLQFTLERAGFRVTTAPDGESGLHLVQADKPVLVILDLMLPGVDGWEVCRRLRREGDTPILILTARGAEDERVTGLEMGADDYIVKPFSPREVLARVQAILRRTGGTGPSRLEFPALAIDLVRREVQVRGELVQLTPKKFDLLVILAREPGRVFSREACW